MKRRLGTTTHLDVITGYEITYLREHCVFTSPEDCPFSLEQVDELLTALIANPYHGTVMRAAHLIPLVDYYTRARLLPHRSWELLLELRRVPSPTWAELESRTATIYWLLNAGLPEVAYQEWQALAWAHPVYSRSRHATQVKALLPPPVP